MADENEKKKKVDNVTKGEVSFKPNVLSLKDDLELEDNREVARYALKELLIPKAKDLLYELLTGTIEKKMYGTSGSRRSGGRRNEAVSYHTAYYKSSVRDRDRDRDNRSDDEDDYRNLFFKERADAQEVLDTLSDLIDSEYQQATIGDLYDAVGKTRNDNFQKNENYGWTNLSSAKVRRVHEGYILDLPRARYLND